MSSSKGDDFMKRFQRILATCLVFALMLGFLPAISAPAEAFTPPHSVVRIGLNAHRSWQLTPNVRLANTSGLRIGSYNEARQFVPSGGAEQSSMTITASGNNLTVTNAAGTVLHTGQTVTIAPIDLGVTTTYTLPNASFGGNVRASFYFFGGFRISASNGLLTIINYVDLEDYLKGVVPYEMPASWPLPALQAQAMAARTFAVRRFGFHAAHGFDLSNTTWCQVYRGMHGTTDRSNESVTSTRGQVILHNGSPIQAVYHSTSGGATEDAVNVWGNPTAYLMGVQDPHGAIERVRWSRTLTPAEFLTHMRSRDSNFGLSDIANATVYYTAMGNVFSVTFTSSSGATRTYERSAARANVATGLHQTFNSQRFTITRNQGRILEAVEATSLSYVPGEGLPTIDDLYATHTGQEISAMALAGEIDLDTMSEDAIEAMNSGGVTFTVTNYGFGHNVGMSQWGAYGLANAGYTAAQIIHFYYTNVTISGQGAPPQPPQPPIPPTPPGTFTDVPSSAWFYPVVQYVREHGLMQGTTTTTFSPHAYTTRGQFVTILGRMADIDPAEYALNGVINGSLVRVRSGPSTGHAIVTELTNGTQVTVLGRVGDWFRIRTSGGQSGYVLHSLLTPQQGTYSDVLAGAFYAPYVEWASSHNIVDGTGDGRFTPGQTISRQEMATMLHRYANAMGMNLPQNSNIPAFADINNVASWARPAVTALQRAGVIQGMGDNNFEPTGRSNRASVASMIANFHENFG